jgi:hypothetical protein
VFAFLLLLAAPAQAADLHHCTGTLTTPEATLELTGYGDDDQAAAADARQVGRAVAARLLSEALWPALMDQDGAGLAPRLQAATVEPPISLPSAKWTAGTCGATPLAEPDVGGWTARVADASAARSSAGLAASAARRQACTTAWATPVRAAVEAAEFQPAEARHPALVTAFGVAREALTTCLAASPTVRAAATSADVAPPTGADCVVLSTDGTPIARGFGPSLDAAGDDAAWDQATAVPVAALADGLDALAHAAPDTRMYLIAKALGRVTARPLPDRATRALTRCAAPPADGLLTWTPSGPDEADDCADDERWLAFPRPYSGDATDQRDALCRAHIADSAAMIDDAVSGASAAVAPTLRAVGWAITLSCDALCRAHTGPVGAATPLRLPGVPARASRADALALLANAVTERDLDGVLVVTPGLNSGALGWTAEHDRDALWPKIAALVDALRAGELPEEMSWAVVGGDQVLFGTP